MGLVQGGMHVYTLKSQNGSGLGRPRAPTTLKDGITSRSRHQHSRPYAIVRSYCAWMGRGAPRSAGTK